MTLGDACFERAEAGPGADLAGSRVCGTVVGPMIPTRYQSKVQGLVQDGRSILLVAPTGLGKTFAVTGDLCNGFHKVVYAVPLRALGAGIRNEIASLERQPAIAPVIHHGDTQESVLFSEEVIVTTYDQVVCGTPGLPLSLPLKAGHAVAGALLMSRLILDEVHLAWSISDQALSILLAIINFRQSLGLQTVVMTATLPSDVAMLISERLGLELVMPGGEEVPDDAGLTLRESNRHVTVRTLEIKGKTSGGARQLDWSPVDRMLLGVGDKRIYFANTVERLQATYRRLVGADLDPRKITVLHNRMPRSWRKEAEEQVRARFGKDAPRTGDWLLLTNQVAEAGLDISAPLVLSDPAPVDTLVQRSGRCARWFRNGKIKGEFVVIRASKQEIDDPRSGLALPYRTRLVEAALATIPADSLSLDAERRWIDAAWGGDLKEPKKSSLRAANKAIEGMTFALNLFDRAAQDRRPGEIASVFREIVSIEVAVDDRDTEEIRAKVGSGQRPQTSSISLGRARMLLGEARGSARVIRYEDGDLDVRGAEHVQLGDVLVVPSTVAFLDRRVGLVYGDGTAGGGESSEWDQRPQRGGFVAQSSGQRQGLRQHCSAVMEGTRRRLTGPGPYRDALVKVLVSLEPDKNSEELADLVAQLASLAAGFHDLGKADVRWQRKAREIDPESSPGLIARTAASGARIGVPHTPPAYHASIRAFELLLGPLGPAEHLAKAIALAAARHHSSLLNPATVQYPHGSYFTPHQDALSFIVAILNLAEAPPVVVSQAIEILAAAQKPPLEDEVPLLLPNDDLFPLYALVGRAILLADREDASGEQREYLGAIPV